MDADPVSQPATSHEPLAPGTGGFVVWAGMAAVVFSVVFGARISETARYPVTLLPLALLGVVALFPLGGKAAWRRMAVGIVPIVLAAVASMVAYFIAASRYTGSHSTRSLVLLVPFAWVAAAALGYRGRVTGSRALHVASWAVMVLSLLGALIGATHAAGLVTGISESYEAWNVSAGVGATSRDGFLRSVGFEIDPNTFGLIGALLVAIGLSIPSRAWVRWGLVGGSAVIVVLSGSRTAVAAVVFAAIAYALVSVLARRGAAGPLSRKSLAIAIVVAMLLVIVLAGVLVATGQSATTGGASAVEETLSGRIGIWRRAMAIYLVQPMGLFQPPEMVLGMSVHNEYIERLVLGGPLLLFALVALLVWLAARVRPAVAPAIGPALAVVYASAALTLGPSLLQAFTSLLFYAVGWGIAEQIAQAGPFDDEIAARAAAAERAAKEPVFPESATEPESVLDDV